MTERSWVASQPGAHVGRTIGNGHCVAYVREATGLGHTSTWRAGPLARDALPPAGTAIATFESGRYGEAGPTSSSFTAILMAIVPEGLLVWDQWVGQPVHQRVIRFQGRAIARHSNDGDRFHVIVTDD